MGGNRFEYCHIDMIKCSMALMALTKELGGREDLLSTDAPTPKEFFEAQKKARTDDVGLQHVASWHCGRCLSYCPVGNWGAKFKATGLSKGV